MTVTQEFFINVLYVIEGNSFCYLQTSDLGLIDTIQQLHGTTKMYNYFFYIPLNAENKNTLITHVLAFNSERHISRFVMFKDNHRIFISYDGFKKGVISSMSGVLLPECFIAKFVQTKICNLVKKRSITQDFFINVLCLFKGDNIYCDFQSSDNNLINNIQQFNKAVIIGNYSAYFPLNRASKKILVDNVIKYNSEEYMHHFAIQRENITLFVAHDGFEIAQIISEIQLPKDFIEKYVKTNLCGIVDKI